MRLADVSGRLTALCEPQYRQKRFWAKENEDGDPTKSSHETFARTADCYLAGNALRVCRENWTVSEHCAASLAGGSSTCSTDFRRQQSYGIHEPLQDRAQDI